MNKDIRKNAKKGFEKRLFKLMNNSFFRKTMKNVHKRKKKKLFGFIFSQKQMILIKIYNNIETRFHTSNYELDILLPKGKVIRLMKDDLGGKIMTKFVGLRANSYNYLIDDGSEDKKARGTRKCVIKRKLKFENYKNCLEATQLENKINHLEKREINIDIVLKKIVKNS